MIRYIDCPVPKEQIPLLEYIDLKKSWFFKIAGFQSTNYYLCLLLSWIIFLPLVATISTGSISLVSNPIKLLLISLIIAFIFPLLLIVRLFLGWQYIYKRLSSEAIIYEETDWHDGQKWTKPNSWRQKDYLISQYEIKPIMTKIRSSLAILSSTFVLSLLIYNYIFTY